jgi:hypothetical protein
MKPFSSSIRNGMGSGSGRFSQSLDRTSGSISDRPTRRSPSTVTVSVPLSVPYLPVYSRSARRTRRSSTRPPWVAFVITAIAKPRSGTI